MKKEMAFCLMFLVFLVSGCIQQNNLKNDTNNTQNNTDNTQIANPSATFCVEQGYKYEIRTDANGSQDGYCIFSEQEECEAWAYFRGECFPKFSCKTDDDCAVKDVHNCCGYFPGCVNKNYTPDIEAVKKECEEEGMVSICGFVELSGCKCENNICRGIENQGSYGPVV